MTEGINLNRSKEVIQSLDNYQFTESSEEVFSGEPDDYFPICTSHGKIFEVKRRSGNNMYQDYALMESIGDTELIFRAIKAHGYQDDVYSIDFKSKKYGYALLELTSEEKAKLERVIVAFINSIFLHNKTIQTIRFSGSGTRYTRKDVDHAREVLHSKTPKEEETYTDEIDPYTLRDMLYSKNVNDLNIQTTRSDFGAGRNNVFFRALERAFRKFNLPYEVSRSQVQSEIFIKRTEIK